MHHYRDLRAYKMTVDAASGKNIPIQNRKIFMRPVWWDFDGGAGGRRVTETTIALNPFTGLPLTVKQHLIEMLLPVGVAPAAGGAPPPPAAPRRNPPRAARPGAVGAEAKEEIQE